MTNEIKQFINNAIELLNATSKEDRDLQHWIPNCIECLQFAIDNEQLLFEKPSLYDDTIDTLNLLNSWVFEDSQYAYIILSKKFGKVYSPEEAGKSLKIISDRLKAEHSKTDSNDLISYVDEDGNYKSTEQILNELSQVWNENTIQI